MKKMILLLTTLIFMNSEFFFFAEAKEAALKTADDILASEPEILFHSEKIKMAPALSRFYLEDNVIIGTNSDFKEIVLLFHDGRTRYITTPMMELEDFVIRAGLIYLLGYTVKGPEIIISNFKGELVKRIKLVATPPSMTSIAVDSKGIIYHNNPSLRQGLITSYNIEGELERIFGKHLSSNYFAEMKLLNRALMSIDHNDHLIMAFRFEPIIRKYDRKGKLIFERKILAPEVLQRMKEEKIRYPVRFTLTKDKRVKISTFTYFTSMTIDEENRIYLKFGPDSLIYQLSPSGNLERKFILAFGPDSIEDFDFWESSIAVDGHFLFFPLLIEGSESFGYILKYKLH